MTNELCLISHHRVRNFLSFSFLFPFIAPSMLLHLEVVSKCKDKKIFNRMKGER